MNILMIGPHKNKIKGGISTVIENYTNSKYLNDINIYNLHTVALGNKVNKLIYCFFAILKTIYLLLFKKIDIVHIHTASGNSFIRKKIFINIACIFKKPIILHIHGGGFEEYYLSKLKTNENIKITNALNKCSTIIVLSNGWVKKIKNMTNTNIEVLHNSVEQTARNCYDIYSKQIIFIGRLEEEKGIYDLIEAAKLVVKEYKDIVFTICGDGDLYKVKKVIKEYNLNDNFNLLGWVDKSRIEEELRKSLLLILPSYKEAMPMCILESMSYGVPVISTNVGSIPEVILPDKNGELFYPGDINNLVYLIKKLIVNDEIRSRYSSNSYELIKKEYDVEFNHNKLRKIYEKINNK